MSTMFTAPGFGGDFYARSLGHVLRSSRLLDYDYALSRDPQVYERMRRDAVIAFALRYRKLLAAGRDWYLEPAAPTDPDRLLLKIMESLLKEMDYFDMARFHLAEAIIAGSRWAHIEGELREVVIDGLPNYPQWWVCSRLRDMDKRRFRQIPVDEADTTLDARWTGGSGDVGHPTTVPIHNRRWIWQVYRPFQGFWQELNRDDYIRHVYEDREDTLGYGSGLASELYTYWYSKEVALQHGLQYLERWSQGIIIAHVDTYRDGQRASYPTSAQKMQDWLTSFEKMRSRHLLVADGKDRVDVKDAPTGGWQAALEAIKYLDGAMRVAILGSTLPTSQDVVGGSYALAEVQQDTTEALSRFDMTAMEESVRRDLLGWLWRKNYAALKALGLANLTLPYFRLREGRQDDHQIRADVILKARQAGMQLRWDECYAQLGLTPPSRGDRILPPLGMQESLNQGGSGGIPPGPGFGAPNPTSDQGRKMLGVAQAERNALRPDNIAGAGKPLREKAIDSITKGFSAQVTTFEGTPVVVGDQSVGGA